MRSDASDLEAYQLGPFTLAPFNLTYNTGSLAMLARDGSQNNICNFNSTILTCNRPFPSFQKPSLFNEAKPAKPFF